MIGKKLKYLRKVHDISQAELADAINVSRQSISLYEIDKRDPGFEVLKKICNYFGVTSDYFFFDDPHENILQPERGEINVETSHESSQQRILHRTNGRHVVQ